MLSSSDAMSGHILLVLVRSKQLTGGARAALYKFNFNDYWFPVLILAIQLANHLNLIPVPNPHLALDFGLFRCRFMNKSQSWN